MKSQLKTVTPYANGIKRFFALAVLGAAISIFFNFLSPQIIRLTVDSIIGTEPIGVSAFEPIVDALGGRTVLRDNLALCALGIIICALINAAGNFLSRLSIATFTERFVKALRDGLFSHIQYLPFSWHTKNQTGDIIQRCTSDIDIVRGFITNHLLQLVRTIFLIGIALALMFSMNVALSLVALVFVPMVGGYSMIFYPRIAKKFRNADEAEGELTVVVQENLTGVRVVRAFGRERYELERFDQKNDAYTEKWVNLGGTLGAYWGVGDFFTGLQILSVIVGGSILAANGTLTLGEFIVFVSYTHTLAWPVRALGRVLSEMSKMSVSIGRVNDILLAQPEREDEHAQTPPMTGDIVFDKVNFSYDSLPVLTDLSFTVKGGSTLGILGETGSGKSTITYLLNRLYDLPEDGGSITIGGVDLRDMRRDHVRKHVGVVLQEPFLFSKTIADNIRVSQPHSSIEDIREFARTAAIDDSIMGFAKGYDTMVGERGVTLSGGQKQRVAISRTLVQRAPIMIFDDSMSALDLETDAQIREALRKDTGDSTLILISHRINTLMKSDKIIVLEQGKIAEMGTHEQLMSLGGIYFRICDLQSKAAENLEGGQI